MDQKLSFSVTIPSAGHYLVVLENRSGTESRAVELRVQGRRASGEVAPSGIEDGDQKSRKRDRPDRERTEERLRNFADQLARFFVFEPIGFELLTCEEPRLLLRPHHRAVQHHRVVRSLCVRLHLYAATDAPPPRGPCGDLS